MDFKHLFFSFDGRINRAKFWLGILIMAVTYLAALFVVAVLGRAAGAPIVSYVLTGIVVIAALWANLGLYIKRLHDRGRSGWWLLVFIGLPMIPGGIQAAMMFSAIQNGGVPEPNALAMLLALISFALALWGFVEIGCLRGTEGPNRFGPDPLPQKATA